MSEAVAMMAEQLLEATMRLHAEAAARGHPVSVEEAGQLAEAMVTMAWRRAEVAAAQFLPENTQEPGAGDEYTEPLSVPEADTLQEAKQVQREAFAAWARDRFKPQEFSRVSVCAVVDAYFADHLKGGHTAPVDPWWQTMARQELLRVYRGAPIQVVAENDGEVIVGLAVCEVAA